MVDPSVADPFTITHWHLFRPNIMILANGREAQCHRGAGNRVEALVFP
jgi:hypothetical protein